jgi:hypothetical protein
MTEFKINAIEKCTKDLINKGFIPEFNNVMPAPA